MWRSKKFIVIAVLAAVVLVGSIGGVAFAQTGNGDEGQPEARYSALLDRVCEIYQEKTGDTIDQEVLADAFAEARGEMWGEKPDGTRLRAPMFGHAGILDNLGIEIDRETLKAALTDAREAVQAGADRQEVMASVLESLGIDVEELQAACAEARETRKEMRVGDADGERLFKRFSHGRSGPCGWGGLCAPTE